LASPGAPLLEVISSSEGFLRLAPEWNSLHERSGRKSAFLTFEWQYSWWESYQSSGQSKALHLVAAREPGGRLAAILPLYLEEARLLAWPALKVLRFIGSRYESSEYLDLIADPLLPAETLAALLDRLPLSGADGVVLTDLRGDSLLLDPLLAWARRRGGLARVRTQNSCPYLPLPGDFQSLLHGLSKNMRYNLGRRSRNLEKEGRVALRTVQEEGEALRGLGTLFDLHRKRWASREGESGFDLERRRRFHELLVPRALKAGTLRLHLLEIDGQPAAALYCFRCDRRIFYYQAGMDPAWEKQSVGLVLMGKVLEASIAEGSVEFDFLRGLEPYKSQWTSLRRDTFTLEASFTRKAALCFSARAGLRRGVGKLKTMGRSIFRAPTGRVRG
jgi:CelD/BcsL family acetyltransferase involved in cellulose biosynthesis